MVKCRVCKKRKDISKFYTRSVRANGLVGECKTCTRERVRQNRKNNAEYYREYDRKRFQNDPKVRSRHRRYQKTEAGKDAQRKSNRKWLKANPEKREAHNIVNNAVRDGAIIKPDTCQVCGGKPKRIEGHHRDYSKPLDVMWLCRSCHVNEHKVAAE